MVLSQRSQYGVRAVLELAKWADGGPVKAAAIASAQQIPVRFLENILAQLRQGGIVESVRGKEGGYSLARHPANLSVGEVIRLLEGDIASVDCRVAGGGRDCSLITGCVLLPMWEEAHQAMMSVFDSTTFEHLLERERMCSGSAVPDYVI
jgi:Rrf2 family cysteine metabolism transcriptional repressor